MRAFFFGIEATIRQQMASQVCKKKLAPSWRQLVVPYSLGGSFAAIGSLFGSLAAGRSFGTQIRQALSP